MEITTDNAIWKVLPAKFEDYTIHKTLAKEEGGYTVDNSEGYANLLAKNSIYVLLSKHNHITVPEIVKLTHLSEDYVNQEITRLIDDGILSREGADKNDSWIINSNAKQ